MCPTRKLRCVGWETSRCHRRRRAVIVEDEIGDRNVERCPFSLNLGHVVGCDLRCPSLDENLGVAISHPTWGKFAFGGGGALSVSCDRGLMLSCTCGEDVVEFFGVGEVFA